MFQLKDVDINSEVMVILVSMKDTHHPTIEINMCSAYLQNVLVDPLVESGFENIAHVMHGQCSKQDFQE